MRPLLALVLGLATLAVGGDALAAASQASAVKVSHAWIRLLPGDLPAGGYATLANTGDNSARLTGARSTAFGMVMLHRSTSHNGMAGMHMVSGIAIPAHGHAALAPGGYHLMLMHRTHPLSVGDSIMVTLSFADGSHLAVPFKLRPANATE